MTASPSFPFGPIPSPVPLRAVELPQDREPALVIHVTRPRSREVLRAVLDAVMAAHDVTEEDLRGRSRRRRFVLARHLCWALLRDRRWTFPAIAAEWRCDHSTIQHGVRRMGPQR